MNLIHIVKYFIVITKSKVNINLKMIHPNENKTSFFYNYLSLAI